MAPNQPIGIAGTGRIAQALGRLLRDAGCPVVAVAGRDPGRTAQAATFVGARPVPLAELARLASRWLIAVRDDALEEVARELTRAGACRGVALHTSGVHGPEALTPLAEAGVSCGALHPLQTVATPEQGVRALRGSAFGLTAEGAAAEWAEEIVRLAGGWILRIPAGRRAEYHAAAALASNCLLAPLDAAVWLMGAVGVPEQDALRALAPIVRASCENGLALGTAAALTGPVRRGDVETVALHLRALAGAPADVREIYRACSFHLIALARRAGLPDECARSLERLLAQGESNDA